VRRALSRAIRHGTSFGAPTEAEVRLAERVTRLVPSIQMVRFVNSGTEATMSAVRLARAATGRKRIVKTEGGYHGHGDGFLVSAGSGFATLGIAGSPGVTEEVAALTTVVSYNDASSLEAAFERFPGEIAAVILEPVAANMGVVVPQPGYLEAAAEIARRHQALLLFDEVITGFRLAAGGAQGLYGVKPDLTVLGKILGGGLPVGAYGGRRDLMEQVAPSGPVYQAGTLSGNPLAMEAGIAMLREITARPPYEALERKAALLELLLAERIDRLGLGDRSGSDDGLCLREAFRHEALRGFLPCDAGARRLPAAGPVRGLVRLDRALGGRPAPYRASRRREPRDCVRRLTH
jgi:glutamate-1-semialdehyde 2,1-aminomutase